MALQAEVDFAMELRLDEPALRSDWRIQLAAERVIERIFQAAEALDLRRRERYFGRDGLIYLRGMRNRLAHNYLGVDVDILWSTFNVDLPTVRDHMAQDVKDAAAQLRAGMKGQGSPIETWRSAHLGRIDPEA